MKLWMKNMMTIILCAVTSLVIIGLTVYLLVHSLSGEREAAVQKEQLQSGAQSQSESPEADAEADADQDADTQEYETDNPTRLYQIADNSGYYLVNNGQALFDYADGYLGGLYTGEPSGDYPGYVQLNYQDGYVLVAEQSAEEVPGAVVLPVGVISQVTDSSGYSACGPACLHMMLKNIFGEEENIPAMPDYRTLFYYAEYYGYADQGSLTSATGGMTCDSLARLASDVYGIQLVNAYSESEAPSQTLKRIIDGGSQAIVLVKHDDGEIKEQEGNNHFIFVTGYVEADGVLNFVYANSYYIENCEDGAPLQYVSADLLDISATAEFPEPNTIAYVTGVGTPALDVSEAEASFNYS